MAVLPDAASTASLHPRQHLPRRTSTLELIDGQETMRGVLIVLGLLTSIDAVADARAGEKKAQLCLTCHKPGMPNALAPLLRAHPPSETPFDKIGNVQAIAHYFTAAK